MRVRIAFALLGHVLARESIDPTEQTKRDGLNSYILYENRIVDRPGGSGDLISTAESDYWPKSPPSDEGGWLSLTDLNKTLADMLEQGLGAGSTGQADIFGGMAEAKENLNKIMLETEDDCTSATYCHVDSVMYWIEKLAEQYNTAFATIKYGDEDIVDHFTDISNENTNMYHNSSGIITQLHALWNAAEDAMTETAAEMTDAATGTGTDAGYAATDAIDLTSAEYDLVTSDFNYVMRQIARAENSGDSSLWQVYDYLQKTIQKQDDESLKVRRDTQDSYREFSAFEELFRAGYQKEQRDSENTYKQSERQMLRTTKGVNKKLLTTEEALLNENMAHLKEERTKNLRDLGDHKKEAVAIIRKAKTDWRKEKKRYTKELYTADRRADAVESESERMDERLEEIDRVDAAAVAEAATEAKSVGESFADESKRHQELIGEYDKLEKGFQDSGGEVIREATDRVKAGKRNAVRHYESEQLAPLEDGVDTLDEHDEEMANKWKAFDELNLDKGKMWWDMTTDIAKVQKIKGMVHDGEAESVEQVSEMKSAAEQYVQGEEGNVTKLVQDEEAKHTNDIGAIANLYTKFSEWSDWAAEEKKAKREKTAEEIHGQLNGAEDFMITETNTINTLNDDKLTTYKNDLNSLTEPTTGIIDTILKTDLRGIIDTREGELEAAQDEIRKKEVNSIANVNADIGSIEEWMENQTTLKEEEVYGELENQQGRMDTFESTAEEQLDDARDHFDGHKVRVNNKKDDVIDDNEKLAEESLAVRKTAEERVVQIRNEVADIHRAMKAEAKNLNTTLDSFSNAMTSVVDTQMGALTPTMANWSDGAGADTATHLKSLWSYSDMRLKNGSDYVRRLTMGTADVLRKFTRRLEQLRGLGGKVALNSSKMATALYSSLEASEKKLDVVAIHEIEDANRRQSLMEERSSSLRKNIISRMRHLDQDKMGQMLALEKETKEKVDKILSDGDLTEKERRKRLRAEDAKLHDQLGKMESGAIAVSRKSEDFTNELEISKSGLSQLVTGVQNHVQDVEVKDGVDALHLQEEENSMVGQELSHAENVINFIDTVRESANKLFANLTYSWQLRLNTLHGDIAAETADLMHAETAAMKSLTNETEYKVNRLNNKVRDAATTTESMGKDIEETVNTTTVYLTGILDDADENLDKVRKDSMDEIEHEMYHLIASLANFTGVMVDASGRMQAKVGGNEARTQAIEKKVDTLLNVSEGTVMQSLLDVVAQGKDVEQYAARNRMSWAGFKAHDLGFKKLVVQKLVDAGVELGANSAAILKEVPGIDKSGLEKETGALLRDEQARMSARLSQIYESSDEAVAALMRDKSLTDEERRIELEKVRSAGKAKATALFQKQRQIQAQQAAIEAQLARYAEKVAAAEEETKSAIEQGHLSPMAQGVHQRLHAANGALARIKVHPLMSSALELGSDEELRDLQRKVADENRRLEREDAEMEKQVQALEHARGVAA